MTKNKLGFTLIELLVVVLIIGVLAAIALPMYQKSVLKSRFAALMPIVKSMNDSNEAYFLEHGQYASNPQDLPVQGQIEYPTGTELEFGSGTEHAYVLASNSSAKNNYIMYQKHSENFPAEIHCEALEGDALAAGVCESFGATQNIGTVLTMGYTTYVLSGGGVGFPPGYNALLAKVDCTAAEALGFTCTSDVEAGIKQMCKRGYCRTITYNEDGSYTAVTCRANTQGKCTLAGNDYYRMATYDANGNKTSYRSCKTLASDGTCSAYTTGYDYTYDKDGNMTSSWYCTTVASDGTCSVHSSERTEYTYDANGNMTSSLKCQTIASDGTCSQYGSNYGVNKFYTYDENGHLTGQWTCGGLNADRTCSAHSDDYEYTYDTNGKLIVQKQCGSRNSEGKCTSYYTGGTVYTYDTDGNLTSYGRCESVASDGTCKRWGTTRTDYTYDGNKKSERYCPSVASDGTCSQYYSGYSSNNYDYTYDANGNMTSKLRCSTVASDGTCSAYIYDDRYKLYYTYDANGNMTSQRECGTVASDGTCSQYNSATDYIYDDSGTLIMTEGCYRSGNTTSGIDTVTGKCVTYNNTRPILQDN